MGAARSHPAEGHLLVVDDEPDLRTLYELTLVREGYRVDTAASVEEALQQLAEGSYDAVITDMRLPDGSGLDVLRHLESSARRERTVVITAYGSAENAVEALKAGAFDYLTKPVDLRQFRQVVAAALGRQAGVAPAGSAVARREARGGETARSVAQGEPRSPTSGGATSAGSSLALERMVGRSAAMEQVRSMVAKVARSMAPVLVHGESGTGKELVARAIHESSTRAAGPFIAVNCGAIPDALLEAEFFGYRKGAFTGAHEDRVGFFQAAEGGTLFLDEIGELPLAMQAKLLRAIQERTVRPLGATQEVGLNVRLVSATHRQLHDDVQAGRFRQDLYYRLNVIPLRLPALRERRDDLPLLVATLLARVSREAGVPTPGLSAEALAHLAELPFAGNVRELENLLHRAVALHTGADISAEDLGGPLAIAQPVPASNLEAAPSRGDRADLEPRWSDAHVLPLPAETPTASDPADVDLAGQGLATHLDQVEREILVKALQRHRYNRTAAGASLGLTLRQMRYRMARLGITAPDDGTDAP